ncbi:MAG TPA: enoyl-CoA hydratase-related protein, partial [Dehalococcoidia bacterium]
KELAEDNQAAGRRPEPEAGDAAGPWDLTRIGKPTVAAVNGVAVGLGVELATQCDVRIASPEARFSWAFPHRGLIPDTGAGTYLLPQIVGLQTALAWTLSGRMIGAEEARAAGFVAELVPPEALQDRAVALAEELSRGAPLALRETKRLLYRGLARRAEDHVEDTAETLRRLFQTEDHREGVQAFLERREPRFTGR